ncbi:hypothetical protein [Metabacillus indicus]|uniref:hypothetical protein n=1 Tax=Metabacillus indicus TaxID=246786 RepID=UPI002491C6DD|nr:hypothetical protein [Metabacillus indicus]
MAFDYIENIHIFSDEESINFNLFNELPDTCPVCSFSISPTYILTYLKNDFTRELLCGCPRNECRALFFAVYQGDNYASYLVNCYPYSKVNKEFPQEVADLSPSFVAIFNQAHHAEQEKLDLICGVAYRKALEYLIKDYVLKMYPEDDSKIKSMVLQQCIQKFITEPSIKLMAERATWLGNDETHYVRKWKDKDLQDLKNLIDLTVYFISMSLKALRYQEEMDR